jgi:hypothetical protein
METPRHSYNRAILSQWCRDVKPEAANAAKMLKSGIIGIAAGLVVAQQTGKMDTAANAAITTATVLGVTLIVTMFVHLLWCWAVAPRKVFSSQEGDILTLQEAIKSATADRDAAIAKCAEAAIPKTRAGNRNDVIKRIRLLSDEGHKIDPQGTADILDWRNKLTETIQECLDAPYARDVIESGPEETRVQDASDKEKAKRWLGVYLARLQKWDIAMRSGAMDHCIRDFSVPLRA